MQYPISQGETVASFCKKYNLTQHRLESLNGAARAEIQRAGSGINERILHGVAELMVRGVVTRVARGYTIDEFLAETLVPLGEIAAENPGAAAELNRAAAATNGLLLGAGITELEIGGIAERCSQTIIVNDELLQQYGRIGLARLAELNDAIGPQLLAAHGARMAVRKKISDLEFLVVEAAAEDPGPGPTAEPLLGLSNDACLWLTYETIFNQRPYRKTNQRLELGLYRIPLARVKVFIRDNIPESTLNELAAAFFPDLDVGMLDRLSLQTWKWKTPAKQKTFQWVPQSPVKVSANREENIYFARQFAILPYNFEDNGDGTHAIGHQETSARGATLQKLKKTWHFWKTASRSLAVDLKPVKAKGKPWQPLLATPFGWPIARLPARPQNTDLLGATERETDLKDAFAQGTALDISDLSIAICGVKTGVQFVGWVDQTGVHKDRLEENSIIACLRSDLIVEQDRLAGRDPALDPELVIQTELLSITERDMAGTYEFGDGVQVRDFSVFNRSKIYFPPISIPFVDRDLTTLKRRFESVVHPAWREFWKVAYAEALGRAKALLLLRYGMQMGSPNAQNMLLEFSPGAPPVPTGRVVIRDVGDMYLHREVLWARFGGSGLPPQGVDDKVRLRTLSSKIIQFEATTLTQGSAAEDWRAYVPYETGSIYEREYGPRGTRFGWHPFSTLGKGSSVFMASPMGTDPDAYSNVWRETCATMCEWGVAHGRAYVKKIEELLGVTLATDGPAAADRPELINWANAPSPERYRTARPADRAAADRFYKEDSEWEHAQERKLHAFLASDVGQEAIKRHPC